MDTQKLLEGLPVKVISREEIHVSGVRFFRAEVVQRMRSNKRPRRIIADRVLLAAMDEFTASNRKPTWEPETVIRDPSGYLWRLEKFIGFDVYLEEWEAFSFRTGGLNPGARFSPEQCSIHRLPHEFSVGDWAQCYVAHADTNAHFGNATFRVIAIGTDSGGTKCVYSPFDRHPVSCCRYVQEPNGCDASGKSPEPVKKEIGATFGADHWKNVDDTWLLSDAYIKRCLRDLRDEILKK